MTRKSVTLLEILVSAMLIATLFAGLLSTFVSVRKYIARAERRLTAANIARSVLEALRQAVREDFWPNGTVNNDLDATGAPQTHPLTDVGIDLTNPIGGFDYSGAWSGTDTSEYYVTDAAGGDYREVRVSIVLPQ